MGLKLLRACLAGLFAVVAISGCQSFGPLVAAPVPATVQSIFLVRHAEKQTGDNPSLTNAGRARAEILAARLAEQNLTHIHSTNYARTLQTAAPTAARTGLAVQRYDPSDLDAFARKLKNTSGNHLVVGHSNTTPDLTTALGGDPVSPIDDVGEYDRIYTVSIGADGEVTSHLERYGTRYATDNAGNANIVNAAVKPNHDLADQ